MKRPRNPLWWISQSTNAKTQLCLEDHVIFRRQTLHQFPPTFNYFCPILSNKSLLFMWFHLPWLLVSLSLLLQCQFALVKPFGILGVSASNMNFHLTAYSVSCSLLSPNNLPQGLRLPSHSSCHAFMYHPTHRTVQFLVKSIPLISSSPLAYVTWISASSHATWSLDLSHFLPKHQQRNHYERTEEWMSDLILNKRLQGKYWGSLLTRLLWRCHIQAILPATAFARREGTIWSTPESIDVEDL